MDSDLIAVGVALALVAGLALFTKYEYQKDIDMEIRTMPIPGSRNVKIDFVSRTILY